MKTYYFGGWGKNDSYGLLSERPFVVQRKNGDLKAFDTLEEAQAYVESAKEEGHILFLNGGVWRRVHLIAS